MHIHIGHHFYGTGNCGDDWMLAGFLSALHESGSRFHITCCTIGSIEAMRRRFPEVEWYPYTIADRDRLIRNSNLWLGLGGTPFQSDSSSWMLDHLEGEMSLVKKHRRPAYMLGVGVEHISALAGPRPRQIATCLEHLWTRDEASAALLATVTRAEKITAGADLAHIYFQKMERPALSPDSSALIYNVERAEQYNFGALVKFLSSAEPAPRWIAQEVRVLNFSEMLVWERLSGAVKERLQLALPDYWQGRLSDLLLPWTGIGSCLSTRYHGALAAAWCGARVTVYPRSKKVLALAEQLECGIQPVLESEADYAHGFSTALAIPTKRLEQLAETASQSCREFFRLVG